uniref:rhomboid protease n=1 Tax=Periophthalmus magnuspinnatus TaxID=409849 RepID=A0A3B3ZA30_9GOBI
NVDDVSCKSINCCVLSSLCVSTRWRLNIQQRCEFKKAARKPEGRKGEEELARARDPPRREGPYRDFGRLVKPMFFTVGFTGCAFGGAAVWQYESLKSRVQSYFDQVQADWLEKLRPKKRGDLRKDVNQWWHSLSEGQRTVTGIIALNVVVFCCWRIPSLQRTMIRYFTADPASKTLCSPLLLSSFSHYSLFHLVANMYVLWSFSSSAVSMLGREQFVAVYLSAGETPSLCSIMTILAAVCTKMPESKLAVIFLPMFTFTAGNALKSLVALDSLGLILGWRFFDHAAHLGGALFGIWYVLFGHELIWKKREPFVKIWHDFRTGGGRGGGTRGGAV